MLVLLVPSAVTAAAQGRNQGPSPDKESSGDKLNLSTKWNRRIERWRKWEGEKKTMPVTPFRTAVQGKISGLMLTGKKNLHKHHRWMQCVWCVWKEQDDRVWLLNKVETSLIWEKALREDVATVTRKRLKVMWTLNWKHKTAKQTVCRLKLLFCLWVKKTTISKVSVSNVLALNCFQEYHSEIPQNTAINN